MHYTKNPESLTSDVLYYTTKDSQIYWTRVSTYLMQKDRHGDQKYACDQLFDGPLESHAALFFIAGAMGLIPMKDNRGMDGSPVLYALDKPLEGAVVQAVKPAEDFVVVVAHLLTHQVLRHRLMNSLLEFHDFLKIIDPPQADRFIGDLVKTLFQRTGDLSPLLDIAGDDEDMGLTQDYPGTLYRALKSRNLLEKAIEQVRDYRAPTALLRFGWQEMRIRASSKARDASLAQDLGL